MDVRELAVRDAYEFIPRIHHDRRGSFATPFQESAFLQACGHSLTVAQTNHSVSRRGTIRGIHFADTPPGQAKYIYCPRGALLDVVVDVRVGSPTFGRWDAVRLDSSASLAVYVAEGLGHAFIALEDNTAMTYLCSTSYNPAGEHGISPLDPALNLPWPPEFELILSDKDSSAPMLADAERSGMLPLYDECLAHYKSLTR
ncbi:dTDP-4-dehydrorhamnose 3,5-epimerase family protein [Phytoactinopolyspora mesophila]|uniref:dTDP-4-dehydrorhamnose 3,5-epimerase n=1 Tax=Phytoactinopolyspora mesophila TaxID=2650750 RepID=A0A7K3MDQ9_9ACTN|nr:dTDP-4-dehydrorhamnose 3,5-epimerase [Phytoactinopolyspora mesophila]NDL61142.1 dTDP-4-dehydrorhamnose 3,5-epimerase [Phytoactinopolyspora mesophila]